MQCGPFTLVPEPQGQVELSKSRSTDDESAVSAIGSMEIPPDLPEAERWSYALTEPLHSLLLLLSFAERRYIDFTSPELQIRRNGEWVFKAMHTHFPVNGIPYGVSWHYGHKHLHEIIEKCLPVLTDRDRIKNRTIRQALQHLRCNYLDGFVERQYLETWTAVEILIYGHLGERSIVEEKTFNKVRKEISRILKNLEDEEILTSSQRGLMKNKLRELNRPSIRTLASEFFATVFADHPAQVVNDMDISNFVAIRNEIAHQGVMSRSRQGDYEDVLSCEHMRLKALLERTLLVLLGIDANLLNFSWTNYLAGR